MTTRAQSCVYTRGIEIVPAANVFVPVTPKLCGEIAAAPNGALDPQQGTAGCTKTSIRTPLQRTHYRSVQSCQFVPAPAIRPGPGQSRHVMRRVFHILHPLFRAEIIFASMPRNLRQGMESIGGRLSRERNGASLGFAKRGDCT
jgi:hypothetical protein